MRFRLLLAVFVATAGLAVSANGQASLQSGNLVDFETGVPQAGAGTLVRTADSLEIEISTSGLEKKSAYTVWWAIWNDPSECGGPCGGDQSIGVPGNAIFNAGSFVTGTDGTGNFKANLASGPPPQGTGMLVPGMLEPGNGFGAVVAVVLRSHGTVLIGDAAEQLSTYLGGCSTNVCVDDQVVGFPPIVP